MTNNQNLTKFQKLVANLKDPVNRKVRSRKFFILLGIIARTFLLIGLCFVILLPIFEKLSIAFRYPTDIANSQVIWIPQQFSTINFIIASEMLKYGESFRNTLLLSTVTTIIQVIATATAGYAFSRLKSKFTSVVFILILVTLVVPNETLARSRNRFFNENPFFGIKLIGNVFSMYIMAAFGQGIRSAIFIFIFRQFFKGIPGEIEESAQVDGAGVIRTFWSVMLPNARGAIVTVALFAFVWQWNDSHFGLLFGYTTGNMTLLAVQLSTGIEGLRTMISTWSGVAGSVIEPLKASDIWKDPMFTSLIANTAALSMMAPLLIGYFFVQKLFVESIERTGIVG